MPSFNFLVPQLGTKSTNNAALAEFSMQNERQKSHSAKIRIDWPFQPLDLKTKFTFCFLIIHSGGLIFKSNGSNCQLQLWLNSFYSSNSFQIKREIALRISRKSLATISYCYLFSPTVLYTGKFHTPLPWYLS